MDSELDQEMLSSPPFAASTFQAAGRRMLGGSFASNADARIASGPCQGPARPCDSLARILCAKWLGGS